MSRMSANFPIPNVQIYLLDLNNALHTGLSTDADIRGNTESKTQRKDDEHEIEVKVQGQDMMATGVSVTDGIN
ncbi:uncharacterized protein Bfra_008362 [Botrytis fragariae]|uniref:Uncharacterized protein n=1 Tax=Botrytis fragariae TaxID=1964551 RepID=A0A8H6ATD0_9HELO|nr:uncharacterized protein Bfra_008362 [Botrytis fragariae]KAF5873085.1 hypothetical protein Bfra_008362 [Botrytis fragariae]